MTEGHQHHHHAHEGHDHHAQAQHEQPAGCPGCGPHDHADHHGQMVQDFRRRFWICAVLTVPMLLLSPMIRELFGLQDKMLVSNLPDSVIFFVFKEAR